MFIVHRRSLRRLWIKNGVAELTAAMLTDGGSKFIQRLKLKMFPMSASFGHQIDKEMLRFTGRVHHRKSR